VVTRAEGKRDRLPVEHGMGPSKTREDMKMDGIILTMKETWSLNG